MPVPPRRGARVVPRHIPDSLRILRQRSASQRYTRCSSDVRSIRDSLTSHAGAAPSNVNTSRSAALVDAPSSRVHPASRTSAPSAASRANTGAAITAMSSPAPGSSRIGP